MLLLLFTFQNSFENAFPDTSNTMAYFVCTYFISFHLFYLKTVLINSFISGMCWCSSIPNILDFIWPKQSHKQLCFHSFSCLILLVFCVFSVLVKTQDIIFASSFPCSVISQDRSWIQEVLLLSPFYNHFHEI